MCEELAKVLLHLSDNFAFDDFSARRHGAMVALAVLCPEQVTPYLTREFYAPNYTLRHRMDILEVIITSWIALWYTGSIFHWISLYILLDISVYSIV